MKRNFAIFIFILILIPALVGGSEAQLKATKKMGAGDPQLNKMKLYLSQAKVAKKKGQGVIRDIRVLIFKINRDLQKCTSTKTQKSDKKNPLQKPEAGEKMRLFWNYDLPEDITICSAELPRQGLSPACNNHVDYASKLSDCARQYTHCIKFKYSYLGRVKEAVKSYCSKGKLTYELNRKTRAKMSEALTKAKNFLAQLDPIIARINTKISDYKACIALEKIRRVRVTR